MSWLADIPALSTPDNLLGGVIIVAMYVFGVCVLAVIGLLVLIADRIRARRRRPAPAGPAAPGECEWCRKPGRRDSYALPRNCSCDDGQCDVAWCQGQPVSA